MFGFGFFDSVFPVLFTVMFVLILGVIIATLVRNVGQWHKNNKSPRLTVQATVVSKRMEVTRHHDANSHMSHSSTWYYATFQVESGDRMELHVSGREYGMLAEGDFGELTFQGTRYLGFERRGSKAAYYDRPEDGGDRQRASWDPER